MSAEKAINIMEAIHQYLSMIERARSPKTMLAYKNALNAFCEMLRGKKLNPDSMPIVQLNEEHFSKFIDNLNGYAVATEHLYLQAVKGFYLYID